MKNFLKYSSIFIIVGCVIAILYILYAKEINEAQDAGTYTIQTLPASPIDANYVYVDRTIQLTNGTYADDSVHMRVVGDPVYGEINGDGVEDAVLVLIENETTYHLALALKDTDGFLGMNIVQLESTHEPRVTVSDEIVHVTYAYDDTEYTEYFVVTGTTLGKHEVSGTVERGMYIFENEQQVVTPCNDDTVYWIASESQSLPVLRAIYTERTYDKDPYSSVYIVYTGTETEPPTEGFGADFDFAYNVASVVRVPKNGSCDTFENVERSTATSTE